MLFIVCFVILLVHLHSSGVKEKSSWLLQPLIEALLLFHNHCTPNTLRKEQGLIHAVVAAILSFLTHMINPVIHNKYQNI